MIMSGGTLAFCSGYANELLAKDYMCWLLY